MFPVFRISPPMSAPEPFKAPLPVIYDPAREYLREQARNRVVGSLIACAVGALCLIVAIACGFAPGLMLICSVEIFGFAVWALVNLIKTL